MLSKRKKGEKPLEIKKRPYYVEHKWAKDQANTERADRRLRSGKAKKGERKKVNLCPKNTSCLKTNRLLSKKKLDL